MSDQLELKITIDEANLILGALAKLPYVQVHELIHKLQSQIGPQLVRGNQDDEAAVHGQAMKGVAP